MEKKREGKILQHLSTIKNIITFLKDIPSKYFNKKGNKLNNTYNNKLEMCPYRTRLLPLSHLCYKLKNLQTE